MARLLARPVRPTAILASNDLTAIGAMNAIFEHGLSVPEDISVIGFDDIELSAISLSRHLPPYASPAPDIARTAFRALFRSEARCRASGSRIHYPSRAH